ncbi:MAG: O-methyltransferase [Candidatus Sigynarchaeota archaeon]
MVPLLSFFMRYLITRPEWDETYYYHEERKGQRKIINEPPEQEMKRVDTVLSELVKYGFINTTKYDLAAFDQYRKLVHENFFIFWTAINPPVERLLYALSYITRPKTAIGFGIFTGNPIAWSFGPAIQKIYKATRLEAVEIDQNNGRICTDNFNEIKGDAPLVVRVEDGFETIERFKSAELDLVYMDANGKDPETGENNKRINYTFLKKAYPKLKPGGLAIVHNAYQESFKKDAGVYLDFTANEEYFEKTATIGIDEQGLEISIKKK